MTKTILIMAITATLILGTFTMATDAFGDVFDEPGTYAIKTNEGDFTCETPGGESCGVGTAKAKFRLLVTNVNEESGISIGVGKTKIVLGSLDGDFVLGNPSDAVPLAGFVYDANNRLLSMTGKFVHSDGAKFAYDAVGNITNEKDDKAKIKFDTFTLTNQDDGNVISVEGLKGNLTVQGIVLGVHEGDGIEINEKGKVLIQTEEAVQPGTSKTYCLLSVTGINQNGIVSGDVVEGQSVVGASLFGSTFMQTLDGNFVYNPMTGTIRVHADMQDQLGNNYTYDSVGNISDINKKGKAKIASEFTMVGINNGVVIEGEVQGGIVLTPISG